MKRWLLFQTAPDTLTILNADSADLFTEMKRALSGLRWPLPINSPYRFLMSRNVRRDLDVQLLRKEYEVIESMLVSIALHPVALRPTWLDITLEIN